MKSADRYTGNSRHCQQLLSHAVVMMALVMAGCQSLSTSQPQLPKPNPFLANTSFPTMHGGSGYSNFSAVAGPKNVSRPLNEDELLWRPTELASWAINYSGPYPDGRRAVWTGGGTVLFKFDMDTFERLSSLRVRDGLYMSPGEVNTYVDKLDSLEGKEYYKLAIDTLLPQMGATSSVYKLVSNENEVYMVINDEVNHRAILQCYGDAIEGDVTSAIELKREWVLPNIGNTQPFDYGLSVNMSYDGRVIVLTRGGAMYAVSRDFTEYESLLLPGPREKVKDLVNAFIRNGAPIDPDGGIYVVTNTQMHRVQWTGQKLSLQEEDGGWSVSYPSGRNGSGTSPSLMGWGDQDDKLVIIGDGRPEGKSHLLAFWRDEIPADWQGIEGMDRRVAGTALVDYGEYTPINLTVENSVAVKGYGVYVTNDASVAEITSAEYDGGPEGQWLSHYYAVGKDEKFLSRGGMKYDWNPDSRGFELSWITDRSFATTVPVVDVNDTLYGIGSRKGVYTLEAVDWNTGELKYLYEMGSSQRYNVMGSSISIAPNGAIDCPCDAGAGIVRIHPK